MVDKPTAERCELIGLGYSGRWEWVNYTLVPAFWSCRNFQGEYCPSERSLVVGSLEGQFSGDSSIDPVGVMLNWRATPIRLCDPVGYRDARSHNPLRAGLRSKGRCAMTSKQTSIAFDVCLLPLVLNGIKTVTRRPCKYNHNQSLLIPCKYAVGDVVAVTATNSGKELAAIQITSVTLETLGYVHKHGEPAKEGFTLDASYNGANGYQMFVMYWRKLYGASAFDPNKLVYRIEFTLWGRQVNA